MKRKIKILSIMLIFAFLFTVISYADNTYKDVEENSPYFKAIQYVTEKALMQGYNGNFSPEEMLSRAAIATILYRMANAETANYSPVYSDVKEGDWYFEAISWMTEQKILNGYADGAFRPNEGVTREQLVHILYNWSKNNGLAKSNEGEAHGFLDSKDIHSYAQDAMDFAISAGLLRSDEEGYIYPLKVVTRGEGALILYRWLNLSTE